MQVVIRNIGPITEATVPVGPGVTVLTGANEAGKSTAIHCVSRVLGKEAPLSVRDGCRRGVIAGLGVTVTVTRRAVVDGTPEVDAVEDRLDLSALVDHRFKSTDAANRHRVKALLSLTGGRLALADFAKLAPDGRIDANCASDDPIEMAAAVKKRFETEAREAEKEAERLRGQIAAIESGLRGVDLSGPCDAGDLQLRHSDAVRRLASLEAQEDAYRRAAKVSKDAADKHASMAAAAGEEMERAAAEVVKAGMELDAAEAESESAHRELLSIQDQIRKLVEQEKKLNADHNRLAINRDEKLANHNRSRERASAAERRLVELGELKRLADAGLPECPSESELDAAKIAVDEANYAVSQGAIIRKAKAESRKLEDARGMLESSIQQAAEYRKAAEGVDEVLSGAVACVTLKVENGELMYHEGDRSEPYARLSDGKRLAVAVREVAAACKRAGGERLAVLPLQQPAWEGLDAANRQAVHDAAVECGVAIITGEAGEGPLRAIQWGTDQ